MVLPRSVVALPPVPIMRAAFHKNSTTLATYPTPGASAGHAAAAAAAAVCRCLEVLATGTLRSGQRSWCGSRACSKRGRGCATAWQAMRTRCCGCGKPHRWGFCTAHGAQNMNLVTTEASSMITYGLPKAGRWERFEDKAGPASCSVDAVSGCDRACITAS